MRGRHGVRATIQTSSQKKQNREPLSQPTERWGRGVRRRNGPTGVYPSWWPGMGKETRAPARPLSSIQHDSTPGGVCASHGPRRRSSQSQQNRRGCLHFFATDRAATFCSDLQDLCCLVLEKTARYDTNLKTTDAIAENLKQGINYLNDHPRPYRWTKTTCLNGIHEAPWNSSRLVQVSVSCPTRIGLIP